MVTGYLWISPKPLRGIFCHDPSVKSTVMRCSCLPPDFFNSIYICGLELCVCHIVFRQLLCLQLLTAWSKEQDGKKTTSSPTDIEFTAITLVTSVTLEGNKILFYFREYFKLWHIYFQVLEKHNKNEWTTGGYYGYFSRFTHFSSLLKHLCTFNFRIQLSLPVGVAQFMSILLSATYWFPLFCFRKFAISLLNLFKSCSSALYTLTQQHLKPYFYMLSLHEVISDMEKLW